MQQVFAAAAQRSNTNEDWLTFDQRRRRRSPKQIKKKCKRKKHALRVAWLLVFGRVDDEGRRHDLSAVAVVSFYTPPPLSLPPSSHP